MAQARRAQSPDYVKAQRKLVIQVRKERLADKEYEDKWGFIKDIRPFLEEEAIKQGMTKEEYWTVVRTLKPHYRPRDPPVSVEPSGQYPKTSASMIGWRCMYPLEIKIPPVIPPPLPKETRTAIFLG